MKQVSARGFYLQFSVVVVTFAVAAAGCRCGGTAPVDAGSTRDAAADAGETDASLRDSGAFMDASDSGEAGDATTLA